MLYFITPQEGAFPGISRLFEETISVIGGEHIYLNDLHKVTQEDTAIFGAWHPQYSTAIRRCKAKEKVVHWASPLLQTELAQIEAGYLDTILQLLDKQIIQKLWVIDANNYVVLNLRREGVFYTPTPFSVNNLKEYQQDERSDVSFFTIFHPRKNCMVQLAAAKLAQEQHEFMLFTNGMSPLYRSFADSIGLQFYDWGFLPQSDYFFWLASSKLSLNVFLSEAFAYTCADALALSIPTIVSPVVANNFCYPPKIWDTLVVTDVSDSLEIAEKIEGILNLDGKEYRDLSKTCYNTVLNVAKRNNKKVIEEFNHI